MSYQLLYEFFQKYFVVHERSAVKNSFSTYVWSKVDSFFLRVSVPLICVAIFDADLHCELLPTRLPESVM